MFQNDIHFRSTKEGQTMSQMSTAQVEKSRKEGKNAGYIKGIARNKEAEILRMRTFSIFAQPVIKPITGDKSE
jgi:hypothetical protein